jgi:hypothetical protein
MNFIIDKLCCWGSVIDLSKDDRYIHADSDIMVHRRPRRVRGLLELS